jgi:hypothetical protein
MAVDDYWPDPGHVWWVNESSRPEISGRIRGMEITGTFFGKLRGLGSVLVIK